MRRSFGGSLKGAERSIGEGVKILRMASPLNPREGEPFRGKRRNKERGLEMERRNQSGKSLERGFIRWEGQTQIENSAAL